MKATQQTLPVGARVEITQPINQRHLGRQGTVVRGLCETELPDGTREPLYEVLFEDGPEIEVWWARPGQLVAL